SRRRQTRLSRDWSSDVCSSDLSHPASPGQKIKLRHGSVVIAAITSCTNTSNPDVMIAAGLVARKARALGLNRKPWVKTSLAPGRSEEPRVGEERVARRAARADD